MIYGEQVFRRPCLVAETDIQSKVRSGCSVGGPDLSQFSSQLIYYHAKVLRFLAVIRAPDSLQHPLMRKRLALLNDESAQASNSLGGVR